MPPISCCLQQQKKKNFDCELHGDWKRNFRTWSLRIKSLQILKKGQLHRGVLWKTYVLDMERATHSCSIAVTSVSLSTLTKLVLFWLVGKLVSVSPVPYSTVRWGSRCCSTSDNPGWFSVSSVLIQTNSAVDDVKWCDTCHLCLFHLDTVQSYANIGLLFVISECSFFWRLLSFPACCVVSYFP